MTRTWTVIASAAVLVAFACTITAQRQMDAMRAKTFHDELLSMPNEHLLGHFTAGMGSVVADLLWIKYIQYTVEHFKGDGKFTWLNHMSNMITRLDPQFVAAYRYGGMFLAALKADDDAGIDLLKRGMVANPDAWELPYEVAMTYLLNRGTRTDSPVHAAHYLGMAVETGQAPQFVLDTAVALQSAHNLIDVERRMWEATRASGDPLMRGLAERKLTEIALRETCAELDRAVAIYVERNGHPPASIEDLVTGQTITAVPTDPLGGRYLIDSAGKVQNTTVLDDQAARLRNSLRTAIDAFKRANARWPKDLNELNTTGIMPQLPRHPYEDRSWIYDSTTGDIR
jgi:hypothetical protein